MKTFAFRRMPTLDLPRPLVVAALGLIACFALPLFHWLNFSLKSELYSYTLLVPLVSAYMLGIRPKSLPTIHIASHLRLAPFFVLPGFFTLGYFWFEKLTNPNFAPQDAASYTMLSFVLLLAGVCAWKMTPHQLRNAAFPLSFLLLMVPFPLTIEHTIESFLQQGSAYPALWLFQWFGTSVFKQDLVFQLPGITIQIAPECSGIRSTLVLFMTSLLAGKLFLQSPWKRAALSAAVIPLALLQNGFRVFIIGQLCVTIGPHMIDSPIHNRGGPIFFALSLVPFFVILFFLVKSERFAPPAKSSVNHSSHG